MKVVVTKSVGFISYKDESFKKGDVFNPVKEVAEDLIKRGHVKPYEPTEVDEGEKVITETDQKKEDASK